MTVRTDPAQLAPYLDAGMQLVPLHHHDHFDEHKGRRRDRGKSPVDANWTKRAYRNADQVEHMRGGDNVGVRLGPCDLVVDVDDVGVGRVVERVLAALRSHSGATRTHQQRASQQRTNDISVGQQTGRSS